MDTTLITAILRGDHDDILDALNGAVQERRKAVREQVGIVNRLTLTPGTKVRLGGNLTPKYLRGLTGTVAEGSRGERIAVKLDTPRLALRYAGPSGVVQCPASCVEAI